MIPRSSRPGPGGDRAGQGDIAARTAARSGRAGEIPMGAMSSTIGTSIMDTRPSASNHTRFLSLGSPSTSQMKMGSPVAITAPASPSPEASLVWKATS